MINLTRRRNANKSAVAGHRLIKSIFDGQLSKPQYAAYLIDVFHYATHSSRVIGAAGSGLVNSHPRLAQYLFHHAQEELGHEEWARSDLRDLGWSDERISSSNPSEACLQMLALEFYYAFHANPVGLFGWLFTLESLGGDVGGNIARAIDACLKLKGKATYFLSGHGEADLHHSKDLEALIDAHVIGTADERDFLQMADASIKAYLAMFDCALLAGDEETKLSVAV
jgi:pyrroloquinoline quinone (PQQ) biosynthesis protein C